MHIDEANLVNLTGLWKKYGSRSVVGNIKPLPQVNVRWPYRCWFDRTSNAVSDLNPDSLNNVTWLDDMPESTVIPVWPAIGTKDHGVSSPLEQLLIEKKWNCAFEQLAMCLALRDTVEYSPAPRQGFKVNLVRTPEDLQKWVDIGSEAFAYSIDYSVINNLLNDNDIKILLGWQDEQAVAAALLYKTGDFIGIHQVGVTQAYQGRGIARSFMQYIMDVCSQWQGKYLVLQASRAGQPLYERLGFCAQFTIKNYQKV